MRAPTLFVRLLRAGGVALALELLWFAMGGRVEGVFPWLRRLGEGAFNLLLAPVAGVALAIAAPWIAARFRWPTSRTSPPEGARSLGSASIAIAVVALVAAWLHLLVRATIQYTFSPDLADGAVICGASAATVVFAFRPPDLRRGLLREEVTLALARAGALLGGAAALVSVSGIIDTGRALGWRFRADDADWFVFACVALASCAALLAFVGRRCGGSPRDGCAGRPSSRLTPTNPRACATSCPRWRSSSRSRSWARSPTPRRPGVTMCGGSTPRRRRNGASRGQPGRPRTRIGHPRAQNSSGWTSWTGILRRPGTPIVRGR